MCLQLMQWALNTSNCVPSQSHMCVYCVACWGRALFGWQEECAELAGWVSRGPAGLLVWSFGCCHGGNHPFPALASGRLRKVISLSKDPLSC